VLVLVIQWGERFGRDRIDEDEDVQEKVADGANANGERRD
jgi:hypothetical protein